jgi:transposase
MDEAGPYQAIPHPGPAWQPLGQPAHRPHAYIRGGTANLLTLFRPASGEVRGLPVLRAPTSVLHPWLKAQFTAILAQCPPIPDPSAPERQAAYWDWHTEPLADAPPVRLLLIWDNLAGHHSLEMVAWLIERGIWPIYTPIAGSWLNLAESVQRILVRRALAGQHPTSAQEVMEWLTAVVAGWNADPTPFVWGGKRRARRQRARERRHRQGGSGGYTQRPIRRCRARPPLHPAIGNNHDK